MTNTMVLNSSFIELSNEEMLGIDGGWWNMFEVGNALMAAGAIIVFAAPPAAPVGIAVAACGGTIWLGAKAGDAIYKATH